MTLRLTWEVSPVNRSGLGLMLRAGGHQLPRFGRLELFMDDRVGPKGVDPGLDVRVVPARLGVGHMKERVRGVPHQGATVSAPVLANPKTAHLVPAELGDIGRAKVDQPPVRPQVASLVAVPVTIGGLKTGPSGSNAVRDDQLADVVVRGRGPVDSPM